MNAGNNLSGHSIVRWSIYIAGLMIAAALLSGCARKAAVTLTYRIDRQAQGADPAATSKQIAAIINKRLNQTDANLGIAEVIDQDRISVKLNTQGREQIESVKKYLPATGRVDLRILATSQAREHARTINVAQASPNTDVIIDEQLFGRWYKIADKMLEQFTQEPIITRRNPDGGSSVLAVMGKNNVLSEHFEQATVKVDRETGAVIYFKMTSAGAKLLGELTADHMPDLASGMRYQLGIFVDDELITAPSINDRVATGAQVTGKFTQGEAEQIAAIINGAGTPVYLILESETHP